MPRSLRVRRDYIGRVKLSIRRNGFPSQQALAEDLGLTRSTVVNFLTGKPVDRAVFEELCLRLSLDSQEIAEIDFEPSATASEKLSIDPIRKPKDLRGTPDVFSFFGREAELATLEQWVFQEQCKLITIFGIGGIGCRNTGGVMFVRLAVRAKADSTEIVVAMRVSQYAPRANCMNQLL